MVEFSLYADARWNCIMSFVRCLVQFHTITWTSRQRRLRVERGCASLLPRTPPNPKPTDTWTRSNHTHGYDLRWPKPPSQAEDIGGQCILRSKSVLHKNVQSIRSSIQGRNYRHVQAPDQLHSLSIHKPDTERRARSYRRTRSIDPTSAAEIRSLNILVGKNVPFLWILTKHNETRPKSFTKLYLVADSFQPHPMVYFSGWTPPLSNSDNCFYDVARLTVVRQSYDFASCDSGTFRLRRATT